MKDGTFLYTAIQRSTFGEGGAVHAGSVVLNSSCLMIRLLPVLLVWRGGLWKRHSDIHWSGKPWENLSPRYVDNN